MPDITVSDLPYIPVIWGAFDPVRFQDNRQRLLQLGRDTQLTGSQRKTLSLLSDQNMLMFQRYLGGINEWTEVTANMAAGLKMAQAPDLSHALEMEEFVSQLSGKLQRTQGNIVVAGRQHSILFPTHQAVKAESAESPDAKVAEFVYDKHIDTVINPGVPFGAVTSASVYNYLTLEDLLTSPIILGPERGLIEEFTKRGEDKKVVKLMVLEAANLNDVLRRKQIVTILEQLKKWGVTHVAHTVDLDVLAPSEGAFAVRYSPITPYLGLGCQILPDTLSAADIDTVRRIKYPTPQVRYLLQRNNVRASQNLDFVREMARADVEGESMFTEAEMETDVGPGAGLRLDEVLKTIAMTKEELPKFGIQDGIRLKSGARYRGAIVEMCGYEMQDKRTSRAALKCHQAIAS